ncbi:MAG: hypothetical protein ABIP18_15325 [Steroidobacteraceae bacterium]
MEILWIVSGVTFERLVRHRTATWFETTRRRCAIEHTGQRFTAKRHVLPHHVGVHMSSSLHEQPYSRPTPSHGFDRVIYERTFVQTVMRLRGITESPTFDQWAIGKKFLQLYDLKVAVDRLQRGESDQQSFADGLARLNAVEHAFMLIRFGSVLPPTREQSQALEEWRSGNTPG